MLSGVLYCILEQADMKTSSICPAMTISVLPVDNPKDLIVPVLKDADTKSIKDISRELVYPKASVPETEN